MTTTDSTVSVLVELTLQQGTHDPRSVGHTRGRVVLSAMRTGERPRAVGGAVSSGRRSFRAGGQVGLCEVTLEHRSEGEVEKGREDMGKR